MILLDTHTWIWWINQSRELSTKANKIIGQSAKKGEVLISSISTWEAVMLVKKGRLILNKNVEEWIALCEAMPFVKFIPVNNKIAIKSASLMNDVHKDPIDRIIVATATILKIPLITKDEKLHSYNVEIIW